MQFYPKKNILPNIVLLRWSKKSSRSYLWKFAEKSISIPLNLTYLIYYFIAPLAFSDGSWWLTGGLDGQTQQPTLQATFFDKILVKLVPGKRLSSPQAGHCIAEVAKSFISAGGYTEKV